MCNILFSDAILEYKLYEALKFIMLYQVTEVYEQMKTKKVIPSLFRLLFSRETSSDPLSFMMNHLNSVGDTCGLEQVRGWGVGRRIVCLVKDCIGDPGTRRGSVFAFRSGETSCTEWWVDIIAPETQKRRAIASPLWAACRASAQPCGWGTPLPGRLSDLARCFSVDNRVSHSRG